MSEPKSIEDLERDKLIAEINNLERSPFKTMTFWGPLLTFLTAAFVYLYLLSNGTFDKKQAHIQWVTDTLYTRSKFLDTLIQQQHDSSTILHQQIANLLGEVVSLKNDITNLKGPHTDSLRKILDITAQLRNSNLNAEAYRLKSDTLRNILDSVYIAANNYFATASSARQALFYNNTAARQKDDELVNYFQKLGPTHVILSKALLRADQYRYLNRTRKSD
jgi:hypothetical protein